MWAGKERRCLNSHVIGLSVSGTAEVCKAHHLRGFRAWSCSQGLACQAQDFAVPARQTSIIGAYTEGPKVRKDYMQGCV